MIAKVATDGLRLTNESQLLRWQIIGGMDIAWEVLVVAMAAYLIWNLQAPLATKIQVVFAFSFRLLYVALTVIASCCN